MSRLVLCLLVALFVSGAFASELCYSATTEAECTAIGSCTVVRGEHCKDDMTPPPCGLQFTIEKSEECCDADNAVEDATHIKFLGCEPSGSVCGIQCMESLQESSLGEVFVIWEGCAFDTDNWKDVSESDECKSCYAEACPSVTNHLQFLLLLAIIPFGLAFMIVVGLLAVAVVYLLRLRAAKKTAADGDDYQRMEMSVEMVPTETEEESASGVQAVDENGVIQVRRLSDGNIRIPMADGTFRVVSSDAYQKLYLKQQKKRYEQYKQTQSAV